MFAMDKSWLKKTQADAQAMAKNQALQARIAVLEQQVHALIARLDALEARTDRTTR